MTYNVRTSNGASITNNGPDELISKWGCLVGQGAGDNPALSTDISSPLFNSRRDENLGFEFIISVIAKTHRKLAGLGFMDDTNGKMDTGNMREKNVLGTSFKRYDNKTSWNPRHIGSCTLCHG
jgi:hypothetical protein